MKIAYTLLFFTFLNGSAAAQDGWVAIHNGKPLLKAAALGDAAVATLRKIDLNKKGQFTVALVGIVPDAEWVRTYMLVDASGNEVWRGEGDQLRIQNAQLLPLSRLGTLTLYTVALPADPAKAALVRVARKELGKIGWR